MKDSLKILLTESNFNRVLKFYNSIQESEINLTDHWSKRTKDNLNSFIFKDNKIFYLGKGDSGLSDNYKSLFDKKFKPKTRLKSLIKRKILHLLKIKNGEAFDPKKSFLDSNFKTPVNIDFLNKEFGIKHNDFVIYKSAYVFNEINDLIDINSQIKQRIVEIGPGTGCLARIIKVMREKSSICLIDINTSIIYSILNLLNRFPNSKYILPNEIKTDSNLEMDNYDFIFLTPELINHIPKSYFNMAINTDSFQEMSKNEIKKYFDLLRIILNKENYFYCVNAVEKIMITESKKEYIRFAEYPWISNDEDVAYNITYMHKDRTTKPMYMKLTKLFVY